MLSLHCFLFRRQDPMFNRSLPWLCLLACWCPRSRVPGKRTWMYCTGCLEISMQYKMYAHFRIASQPSSRTISFLCHASLLYNIIFTVKHSPKIRQTDSPPLPSFKNSMLCMPLLKIKFKLGLKLNLKFTDPVRCPRVCMRACE